MLLSDSGMEASAAFGLAFALDDATVQQYRSFGITLTARQGDRFWLPVPAVYVVGADGVIAFAHADPDYRRRLPMPILLAAVQAATEPGP